MNKDIWRMKITAPKFIKRMMPELIWGLEDDERVFLTFDDGPTPGITEYILQQLDKYNAKATFFCLGKNVEMYPDLYERIIAAGHKVGNHSYSHIKGWGRSEEEYVEDVDFANQFVHSDLYRPPYGRITGAQAKALAPRYRLIMWDVLSQDYNRNISPQKCLNKVLRHVKAGSVVVFHDSVKAYKNMYYALPRTLQYIKEQGLRCSTIELWKG